MYNISCDLPNNREPWQIPLETRREILLSSKRQGRKVALMLYHQADTSTFRYRCYNVYQATMESKKWQAVYFFMSELSQIMQVLPQCDLLILSRQKWYHYTDHLVQHARSHNIPVLYDVDDLVVDLNYLKLVTNTLNVQFLDETIYDFWFAYISRNQQAAACADGFITTNPFLGNRLQAKFGKPYQVIENSLNQEQVTVSAQCSSSKNQMENKKPFTIGYFSGTPSHINDFKVVYMELIQLLEDYPDMELQVVGFMEFPELMNELIQKGRVKFTPLVDFLELQRLMAQVDVSIVPLVNNTFTNCKSELKFFEAAVVDTVTIATPTYTYANAITHGETGFLCNPGQWYDTIAKLYHDPEYSRKVASAAKEYSLRMYHGNYFLKQIESAYDYFAAE